MNPIFAASTAEIIQIVVGSGVAVVSAAVAIWSYITSTKIKKQQLAHEEQKEEVAADKEIRGLIDTLQKESIRLDGIVKSHIDTCDKTCGEYRDQIADTLEALHATVGNIRENCIRHQSSFHIETINEMKGTVKQLSARVERVTDMLRAFQDAVNDKFVTIQSYQHDLKLWTDNFNTMRQMVGDLNSLVGKMIEASAQRG